MPSIRRALATAALAGLLAVSATACGGSGDGTGSHASASPSPVATAAAHHTSITGSLGLPSSLPTTAAGLAQWKRALKNGGWKNWDRKTWLRKAADFVNPVIKGLWDPKRMKQANQHGGDTDKRVPSRPSAATGQTDPAPAVVPAQAVRTPYSATSPAEGKLFFDSPKGSMVCSATVVTDPAHPGKSDLVWTAGHCVHAGAAGGWYRNIVFVPDYNSSGLSAAQLKTATRDQVAPKGVWWADWAATSKQWISEGAETGGKGSPYDFAVLHVTPEKNAGKSLQETVGAAVPVAFDVPSVTSVKSVRAWGYPAAPPFDGQRMFSCQSPVGRLSLTATEPTEYRIGCTMTGGSSGGGWFATGPDGKPELISNTSIGPVTSTWLAGPHLGSEAKSLLDSVSSRFS
jgi:V8-like Glu-specific endopeptidase